MLKIIIILLPLIFYTHTTLADEACSSPNNNPQVSDFFINLWSHPRLGEIQEQGQWTYKYDTPKCSKQQTHFIQVQGFTAIEIAKLLGAELPKNIWDAFTEQELFGSNIFCFVAAVQSLKDDTPIAQAKAGLHFLEIILSADPAVSDSANSRFSESYCQIPLAISSN